MTSEKSRTIIEQANNPNFSSDWRDNITPFSCEDIIVGQLAEALALACGTEPTMARLIGKAAMLHDVGKFQVPTNILNKPSGLSPSEYTAMKTHTIWGANILMQLPNYCEYKELAQDIALYHHEKYDGSGYWGKRTNDLPYFVHIVTLCDVYTALTSSRPYKHAWTKNEALEYISIQAGKQFSPILAYVFIQLMRKQNSEPAFLVT